MYNIYGTQMCGYCTQAKQLLESKNIPYNYVDLTELSQDEKNNLMAVAGTVFRTVPQIFSVENNELQYVGGFTDLKNKVS